MGKVKMELKDAVNAYAALQSFSNSSRLGWELSWEIDDIVEALEKHQKRLQEEGDKILKAFGEPIDGQPGRYNVLPEKNEEYQKAMDKLQEIEVTVEFEPLTFDKLDKSGVKVQGREMRALRKHFIVKEAPKKLSAKERKALQDEVNDKSDEK